MRLAFREHEVSRLCVDFQINDLIQEHYRLLGVLGRGEMGRVYRAVDVKQDRRIAVNVVPYVGQRGTAFVEKAF